MVRETHAHVVLESSRHGAPAQELSQREVFWRTTLTDRNLSSISQGGFVNNLNDGMAPVSVVFFRGRLGLGPYWHPRGNLSGDVGRLPACDRCVVGSRRTKVVDCER
jgi:hypothetical protein